MVPKMVKPLKLDYISIVVMSHFFFISGGADPWQSSTSSTTVITSWQSTTLETKRFSSPLFTTQGAHDLTTQPAVTATYPIESTTVEDGVSKINGEMASRSTRAVDQTERTTYAHTQVITTSQVVRTTQVSTSKEVTTTQVDVSEISSAKISRSFEDTTANASKTTKGNSNGTTTHTATKPTVEIYETTMYKEKENTGGATVIATNRNFVETTSLDEVTNMSNNTSDTQPVTTRVSSPAETSGGIMQMASVGLMASIIITLVMLNKLRCHSHF